MIPGLASVSGMVNSIPGLAMVAGMVAVVAGVASLPTVAEMVAKVAGMVAKVAGMVSLATIAAMIAGKVGETVVQFVVEKAFSFGKEKILRSPSLSIKTRLTKLKKSLAQLDAILHDADNRQIKGELVEIYLNNLRDVAYEADNLLDEFHYETLVAEVPKPEKRKWIFSSSSSWKPMGDSVAARRIKELQHKLKDLLSEASMYGLQATSSTLTPSLPLLLEPSSRTVDPTVRGRDVDASKIVETLTSATKEVVSIIPIVGMSGLGKTTLARLVFKHSKIVEHFKNERIWVCVSKTFDTTDLLRRILESLTNTIVQEISMEAILNRLQEKLNGRKYLLVLDDLWNVEAKWGDFKKCLLGINSNPGNFVIATTRLSSVELSSEHVYDICPLSDKDCWSLISEEAFSKDEKPLEEIVVIGEKIARKCKGLPLAANVVGATLRGRDKDDWISISQQRFTYSSGKENGILPILKVSFDRLPSLLIKRCFAYCSIFEKDAFIGREQLIQLWMAEGFLEGNNKIDGQMEILGNKIFSFLLENFFLQQPQNDEYGNVIRCKMHDLMHDLAIHVSKKECFSEVNHQSTTPIPPCIRYLVVKSFGEKTYKEIITKENAIYLRTLFSADAMADDMFKNVKFLHVLKLQNREIEKLSNLIGDLIHLRLLDVSGTRIKKFPESICKLLNLQTLGAFDCRELSSLPDQLKLLVNMRHILLWRPEGTELSYKTFSLKSPILDMPLEIRKLTHLRTLPFFNVGVEEGRRIDELGYLENLQGELEIRRIEVVKDKEEAMKAKISQKANLQRVSFVWSVVGEAFDDRQLLVQEMDSSASTSSSKYHDMEVLEGLEPHENIKSLVIENFMGDDFPTWVMMMSVRAETSLINLIHIELLNCKRCHQVPTLGHLPRLKKLRIEGLINVKSIGPSFYYPSESLESSCNGSGHRVPFTTFPALVHFTLKNMHNLTKWIEAFDTPTTSSSTLRINCFPTLEYLEISGCGRLKSIPHCDIPSSVELKITGSPEAAVQLKLEEAERLFSVNPELAKLKESFANLQKLLHNASRIQLEDEAVNLWLKKADILINNTLQLENSQAAHRKEDASRTADLMTNYVSSVRTSPPFKVGVDEGCRIDELGYLENLQGVLEIHRLEVVKDKEEAMKAKISGKKNLQRLHFVWSERDQQSSGNNNDTQVLEGLKPHENIKSLAIVNFMGDKFPQWVSVCVKSSLNNLISIELLNCKKCQQLPTLGHLPLLKKLRIERLINVKSIGHSFYCPNDFKSSGRVPFTQFPALQHFEMKRMDNLEEWVAPQEDSSIIMSAATSTINCFPVLKKLDIWHCFNLESIPDLQSMQSLERLTIWGCDTLKIIGYESDQPLQGPTSLKSLEIENCDKLESIPNLQSLETLKIGNCSNLKRIGYESDQPLQGLTSLTKLKIRDCPKLESFSVDWELILCLSKVYVEGCLNWRSLPRDIGSLSSTLTDLRLGGFDDFNLMGETLKGLQSLRILRLIGKSEWSSLPDQLQHLTTLTELRLYYFGVSVLPEWFANFSSLNSLDLIYMKKLRCLPSKEVMLSLSNLQTLNICACSLLEKRCRQPTPTTTTTGIPFDDSQLEWSKISHIPNVCIIPTCKYVNPLFSQLRKQIIHRSYV